MAVLLSLQTKAFYLRSGQDACSNGLANLRVNLVMVSVMST